jgi:hypothetical protein
MQPGRQCSSTIVESSLQMEQERDDFADFDLPPPRRWALAVIVPSLAVNRPLEGAYVWRAGCAPFVVFSFLTVGLYALDQVVTLPGDFVWTLAVFGLSVAAGAAYLWCLPWTRWHRVVAIGLFAAAMVPALAFYGLFFGMIVLGVFP